MTLATEKEFLDALSRLKDQRPTNRTLIHRKARGQLRVNISSVALEAGYSRTLIGHEECSFPNARTKILAVMQEATERRPTRVGAIEALSALRAEKKELEAQISLLATQLVEAQGVVRKMEARHQIELRRARGAARDA